MSVPFHGGRASSNHALAESADFADVLPPRIAPPGFELIAPAGRGTFSEIWKIRGTQSGRVYALKRLRPQWEQDLTANHLLKTETAVGRAVKSPHVVQVVHSGFENNQPFNVLEWLDGVTLSQALDECGRLPVGRAVWITRQIINGLADLEEAGFVHGDVKPDNIFLCSSGVAKLIDLGFARAIHIPRGDAGQSIFTGTAEYVAPESLTKDAFTPVARDVYSLGVTLFQMLAGRVPFAAGTTAATLRLQRQARPPQLASMRPDVPITLQDLVDELLAKQPVRRPLCYGTLLRRFIDLELSVLPGAA